MPGVGEPRRRRNTYTKPNYGEFEELESILVHGDDPLHRLSFVFFACFRCFGCNLSSACWIDDKPPGSHVLCRVFAR